MSITFAKAPLVEIVAELRWGRLPQLATPPNQAIAMPLQMAGLNANKLDEFFMRLGGEIYQQGFNRAERLVPPASRSCSFSLFIDTARVGQLMLQCCSRRGRDFSPPMRFRRIAHGKHSRRWFRPGSKPY